MDGSGISRPRSQVKQVEETYPTVCSYKSSLQPCDAGAFQMLGKCLPRRCVSAAFSTLPISHRWRADLKNRSLAAQITSLLLHRKDWIRRLRSKSLFLPGRSCDDLVRRVLSMTRSHPDLSLEFFNWAQSDLGYRPDLHSLAAIAWTLVDAGLLDRARWLLDPVLLSYHPHVVVNSLSRASQRKDSRSRALNFVLETYSTSGLISGSLEIFRKIVAFRCQITTRSCNALLDALSSSDVDGDGVRIAWRCYAAALRNGAVPDSRTWSLLSRLLCREGKLEKAVLLLVVGGCRDSAYDLVIDCFCRKGEFGVAIGLVHRMREVNMRPRFTTYCTILDSGSRFGDDKIMGLMLREMLVYGFLPTVPCLDYDRIICRLCELEKIYVAKFFFDRARKHNVELGKRVYLYLLKTMSKEGIVWDALELYGILLEKGIKVNPRSCKVFVSGICNGNPSMEVDQVLEASIKRGVVPKISDLSKYIAAQLSKSMWKEAGHLIDTALQNEILLDGFCFYDLVRYYSTNGLVDSALELHERLKKLGGCFDLSSYKLLLKTLLGERRSAKAIQVFDYMQGKDILDGDIFVTMICELCHSGENRRAMNLHDEMLKLGYKPNEASYRNLISHFS
ncbi:pentatricopeptide repeat-containing protein At4g21170-like [Zingiber officinale]|uniref:Pentatricopeptide repeat-containing protein n=1 Tax=Zingiber officinale TaxID=94328 RepID=A0A8J5HU78_ZINOF|nr:pentatricopeptide repeat-containing protein At4g21170-like [Zingiber officinale]KAG6530670.1 hypothetical protein ZIOFF_012913 [Zingiber officinale]